LNLVDVKDIMAEILAMDFFDEKQWFGWIFTKIIVVFSAHLKRVFIQKALKIPQIIVGGIENVISQIDIFHSPPQSVYANPRESSL
jgi:hypothetical protein